jgi:glycosyltransferase involved in cell wall biosynthesis
MDVHLIGPLPPPFGGVSVHIKRLREALLAAGHRCMVWGNHHRPSENIFAIGSLRRGLRHLSGVAPGAILHFHQYHLLAGLMARKRSRVVFTVHNERINDTLRGGRFPRQWLYRKVAGRCFANVKRLLAVSERAKDELVRFGFEDSAITVVNAYLRPGDDEQAHPDNLRQFREFRRRFGVVATANAWALRFFGGEDLYGIDMCLEMLHRLAGELPDLGVALALPLGRGTEYLTTLERKAGQLGVSDRVLWLMEPGAYHPILKECDLFLRPTNTEGFSISIVESFEYGLPVVASDAVPRPEACLVFRNRDVDDFVSKVREAIQDRRTWSKRSLAAKEPEHFQEILSVYESLLG